MSRSVESRLRDLENENNARKASYPVAGSSIQFKVSKSKIFHIISPNNPGLDKILLIRIKFIPKIDFPKNSNIMVSLISSVMNDGKPYYFYSQNDEIQEGGGEILLRLSILDIAERNSYDIQVTSLGAISGTFELISTESVNLVF